MSQFIIGILQWAEIIFVVMNSNETMGLYTLILYLFEYYTELTLQSTKYIRLYMKPTLIGYQFDMGGAKITTLIGYNIYIKK